MGWEDLIAPIAGEAVKAIFGGGDAPEVTNVSRSEAATQVEVNPSIFNIIDTAPLVDAQASEVAELQNIRLDLAEGVQTLAAALVLSAVILSKR